MNSFSDAICTRCMAFLSLGCAEMRFATPRDRFNDKRPQHSRFIRAPDSEVIAIDGVCYEFGRQAKDVRQIGEKQFAENVQRDVMVAAHLCVEPIAPEAKCVKR